MIKKKIIVLLGPAGSFSDSAADRLGSGWKKKYVPSIRRIFEAVKKNKTWCGFVPVRNKIIGEIRESAKYLKKRKFRVLQKIRFSVNFVLAAKKKIPLTSLRKIYCSKIVKAQCEKFIGRNFSRRGEKNFAPRFALNFPSSSAAFKKVVQLKLFSAAAIGSERGAKLYKLHILARNIQDDPGDWTEFALVRRQE